MHNPCGERRPAYDGKAMAAKRLLVINGHPDPRPQRFCAALAASYGAGAARSGWQVRHLAVGHLPHAMLEAFSRGFFDDPDAPALLADFTWAGRIALIYPLWYERPPQGVRAVFSYLHNREQSPLGGRKAHVVVTMDMPAFALRSMLRPGSPLPATLDMPGLLPQDPVFIGCVSSSPPQQREEWLKTMQHYGEHSSLGAAMTPTRIASLAAMIDRTVSQWWA